MSDNKAEEGSSPSEFQRARAADVMNPDVVWCTPETSLREVARTMAERRMHAVVVGGLRARSSDRSWGVVSDVDLLRAAAADLESETAGAVAATELPTVNADETLPRAVQIMAEHEVTHLIVVDSESGEAVGVLSSLDIAGFIA